LLQSAAAGRLAEWNGEQGGIMWRTRWSAPAVVALIGSGSTSAGAMAEPPRLRMHFSGALALRDFGDHPAGGAAAAPLIADGALLTIRREARTAARRPSDGATDRPVQFVPLPPGAWAALLACIFVARCWRRNRDGRG
jgi:hypothetical protein